MNENLKPIPIEDERLTPDMGLTRAGTTMLFRKDYGDRKFTREENADAIIEAPRPELKAELKDGKWYWVNDCPECNGEEPRWAYVKCEEHDRCVSCRRKIKDIKNEQLWGHEKGFRCGTCQTILNEKIRTEALEKVASKEYDPWDYQNTDNILCPHCATEQYHESSDGEPNSEMVCEVCGGKFSVMAEYTIQYSTEVIGERITLNRVESEE